MMRKRYIFGWESSEGKQLYMRSGKTGVGVTTDAAEADKFRTTDLCIQRWRDMHAFPGDYEHCIHNGYLTFFIYPSMQRILV